MPVAVLVHAGDLITSAAAVHSEIAPRMVGNYLTDTTTVLGKVSSDVTGQKNAKGELGNLNATQRANLERVRGWMAKARKTAKRAFLGQTVKLHQEFQVGVKGPRDLNTVLGTADIILASVQTPDNLPVLKVKGWTDADTQSFVTARGTFGTGTVVQSSAKGGAKTATNTKNTDAADLYDRLLTIQNAADLQWPADDPANSGIRDEFQLNTFPPGGGSSTGTTPPPIPTGSPAK